MSLLTIAELLAGEALITPGGPVDRVTAIPDDHVVWGAACIDPVSAVAAAPAPLDAQLVLAGV